MRRFLTLRWIRYHVLMVVLVVTFLALGWWQWTRGEGGNARSYGYALEWPAFAIFVVVFWVRMIRDELKPPKPEEDEPKAEEEPEYPDVARPEVDPDEDPELAAYNAYLARLNEKS